MGTISMGGHDVATDLLLLLLSIAVWMFVGMRMAGSHGAGVGALLARTMANSVLAARAGFVLTHTERYSVAPWRILDLSDGGYTILAGFVAAALATIWFARRRKSLLHKLVTALAAGLPAWGLSLQAFWLLRTDQVRLPGSTLASPEGRPVDIQDFSGPPVVVNLWATWCPPCRREMPLLAVAQQREKDMVFLFAGQAERASVVAAWLAKEDLILRNVLLDPLGQFAVHAGTQAVPRALFFNERDVLVRTHKGELSAAAMGQYLDLLRPVPVAVRASASEP